VQISTSTWRPDRLMSGRRGKRGGGGGGHEGGDERWLLTYADMITLLLALFIVLFAMSTINAQKFDFVRRSLSQTFKGQVIEEPGQVLSGSDGVLDPTVANQSPDNTEIRRQLEESSNATARDFSKEQAKFEKIAQRAGLQKDVQISPNQRGFTISIAGDALFDSGSATIKPEMARKLDRVSKELIAFRRSIAIEGHTDGAPINGAGGFLDNDELSCGRALSVKRLFLTEGLNKTKMEVTCLGDSRPKVRPKNPTDSVPANRRIEIIVLASGSQDGGLPETDSEKQALDAKLAEQVAADRRAAARARMSTTSTLASAPKRNGAVIGQSMTIKPDIAGDVASAVDPISQVAGGG